MAHETLRFSRSAVDRAAKTLLDESATTASTDIAWDALANWRAIHAFPLNTIKMDLRQKVKKRRGSAHVVQRLKRARSILAKLQKEASMRLTQMQDIGGCRAVVPTIDDVYALREQYRRSRSRHVLVAEDDYIANPKASGYRSLHLVYRFQSQAHPQYNRLMFEVQLRTTTQHAWATAVETVGAVIGQALKSSEGEHLWLTYFQNAALALEYTESQALAAQREATRGTIARTLHELGRRLDVHKKLSAYRTALKTTASRAVKDAAYFLLVLLPDQNELQIRAFSKKQSEEANRAYEQFERRLPLHPPDRQLPLFPELSDFSGAQAVLVGADSLRSIRDSYPNYYLDTQLFLEKVAKFVRRYQRAA